MTCRVFFFKQIYSMSLRSRLGFSVLQDSVTTVLIHDFLALQDSLLCANVMRYFILHGDGGVYTGLDTLCL